MRVLFSADIEGATGVTWPADVEPGTEQWQRCRRMFTSDVNAAIDGFFAPGADEVLVNEAHATMRNLLLEELDHRAVMLTGRHKELSMVEGVEDPEVTAAAITAAAARAGKRAGRRSPGRPGVPGEDGTAAPAGFTIEAQLAQAAAIVPTVERTGDRTVSYRSPTARDMIRCFKAVTTMIAAATEDSYG